jgi:hypothetical protein
VSAGGSRFVHVSDSGAGGVDQQVWSTLVGRSERELAGLVAANHADLLVREARVLLLAAAWADAHDVDPASPEYRPLVERACAWGGEGTPEVSEYCAAELGALQGTGIVAARMLIADALDLRHRLPTLWARVQAGEVRAWQARKVAQATRALPYAAARDLDVELSGYLGMLPWPRFQKLLAAAVLAADPVAAAERDRRARGEQDVWAHDTEDGLKLLLARAAAGDVTWFLATVNRIAEILGHRGDTDPVGARRARAVGILAQPAVALQLLLDHREDAGDGGTEEPPDSPSLRLTPLPAGADLTAARPRVVLHFHLSDATVRDGQGLVRPEHGDLVTLGQLRDFLTGSGCVVQVRPVLDPAHLAPVDGYETPARLREAMRLRHPTEVFPYGTSSSATLDLDHTVPYRPPSRGGPPGQTRLDNLGPLGRPAHRAVTHGRWRRRQPEPGRYLFRSPTGHVFLVTNQGTQALGCHAFAEHVWRAAAPGRAVVASAA